VSFSACVSFEDVYDSANNYTTQGKEPWDY
jgi:hypothetical protein